MYRVHRYTHHFNCELELKSQIHVHGLQKNSTTTVNIIKETCLEVIATADLSFTGNVTQENFAFNVISRVQLQRFCELQCCNYVCWKGRELLKLEEGVENVVNVILY